MLPEHTMYRNTKVKVIKPAISIGVEANVRIYAFVPNETPGYSKHSFRHPFLFWQQLMMAAEGHTR